MNKDLRRENFYKIINYKRVRQRVMGIGKIVYLLA